MMIESDIVYAFIKKSDWLKPVASALIELIARGKLGVVYASREIFHELYYLSLEEGISAEDYLTRAVSLFSINNLVFLPTTPEIDLIAFSLMVHYKITSIFDAYYAATALNQVEDHVIISTDHVYDKVPGITRIDPRQLVKNHR